MVARRLDPTALRGQGGRGGVEGTTLEASEKGTVPLRNRRGLCCLEEHGSEYTSGRCGWGPERLEV